MKYSANVLERKELINTLYDDRVNYTIVALTGYTGTGCSVLGKLMCMEFQEWQNLRKPEDLFVGEPKTLDNEDLMYSNDTNHKNVAETIFAQKYAICYNFTKEYYKPFKLVKYSHVLMFYTLQALVYEINKDTSSVLKDHSNKKIVSAELQDKIKYVLKDKYRPSRETKDDDYRAIRVRSGVTLPTFEFDQEGNNNFEWEEVHSLKNFNFTDWDLLFQDFDNLGKKVNTPDYNTVLSDLFFGKIGTFCKFIEEFNQYLWKNDPYCCDFFYHRLGFVSRATGNPLENSHAVMHSSTIYGKYLYDIVYLIKQIIKGYKKSLEENAEENKIPCRIVIDKIRNSLEAKYLKERYAAFYMIAVHEEKEVEDHLGNRIKQIYPDFDSIRKNEKLISLQKKKILILDSIERKGDDFENGKFFAQNLSQCVADSEIHISNEQGQGGKNAYFYSMSEQWMKYASLIQHPGLITPSSEERCMVVAYTAKFNSGCISRQVGAVITNKAHTIRSIGWNDVPYGQIPCSLRNLKTMVDKTNDKLNIRQFSYSDYELGDRKRFKDGLTFNEKTQAKYKNLHLVPTINNLMAGLPHPYCFKSLQNEFDGEKNQVHTRALHAEENAILQMAKYGGEGLFQGIIYVTASPCELCCKKLYQIGVRKIVYIDEYPGISRENIISSGYHRPRLKQFQGAYGATYFKLYQPILPYKEELSIRLGTINIHKPKSPEELNLENIGKVLGIDLKDKTYSEEEIVRRIKKIGIATDAGTTHSHD